MSENDAANAAAEAADSGDMKMQRMSHWLKQQGATFPSVKIEDGQYGRELRAAAPIKDRELVMHIPDPLMLTVARARESAIGRLMAADPNASKLQNYAYLAAWLLELKREGGFWQPYLDMLPADFSEHPCYFSDAEVALLEGSYLMHTMRMLRGRAEYEYQRISPLLPAAKAFTLQEYAWARVAIGSRAHATMHAGKPNTGMVPLADMPNHSLNPNMRWRGDSAFGFVCIATRDIDVGEPLTISYGMECNGHWFSSYGFCLESNPHNQAEIELPELPADHPWLEQAKPLGTMRNGKRVFEACADYQHRGTRSMFSYLRLYAMSVMSAMSAMGDAATVTPGKDDVGLTEVVPASRENEQAALHELALACQRWLQAFPTSIEADAALLKEEALPLKLRNAVRVRHDEKAVLHYFLEMVQTAMPMQQAAEGAEKFAAYFKKIAPLLTQPAGKELESV